MRRGFLVLLCLFAGAHAEELLSATLAARDALEWPGVDVASAAHELGTPYKAFEFVRDDITKLPYAGSWNGAEGTLRTRTGNSADCALLLAALLRGMGVECDLVTADWPEATRPSRGKPISRHFAEVEALTMKVAPDYDPELVDYEGPTADDLIASVQQNVARARETLEDELDRLAESPRYLGSPAAGSVAPSPVETEWIWVRAKLGDGEVVDMDPLFLDLERPAEVRAWTPQTASVRIAIVTESAGGERADLLEWRGPSAQLIGHDVQMIWLPADEGIDSLLDVVDPAKVQRWRPVLQIGSTRVIGGEMAPLGYEKEVESGGFNPFGGGGKKKVVVPPPAAVHLSIEVESPVWSRSVARVLQRFGEGFDSHEMISTHRIGFAVSALPIRPLQARVLDELADRLRIEQMAADGKDPGSWSSARGISTRSARVLNSLALLVVGAASPETPVEWQGPTIFLESLRLQHEGDAVFTAAQIDVLHQAMGVGSGATRRQRIEWGLATAEVEARLLGAIGVNQVMIDQAGTLEPESMAGGGLVLRGASDPTCCWALLPDGQLLALLDTDTPAKGASARARADAGGMLYGALGSGAMAMLGAPSGMLVTGLVEYFRELAKAYHKAASVLEGVAEAIETGDSSKLDGAGGYFEKLGQHLMSALTSGVIRGYTESVISAGISITLPTGPISDGLIATGLSLSDSIPTVPAVVIEEIMKP